MTGKRRDIGSSPSSFTCAAALGLVCFGIYLATLCPTVYLGDSGEFTAAAFFLGIPHNSGYPLYSLLGKLFCLIPLGNIAFRMNVMSAALCASSVALLYSQVLRMTGSRLSSFGSASMLAFLPLFWMQAVCAEVYALHLFLVLLMISLLWWWDQDRRFCKLLLFTFVVGLSFGNHMQTVMLAPAVLFLILRAERLAFFSPTRLAIVSLVFVVALSLYLYLPLRTEAGAAITWGDPNTLDRFMDHVLAKTHRGGYVLTKGSMDYVIRAKEALSQIGSQFGFALVLALWGWLRGLRPEWKIFFALLVAFDLVYTVFLNVISLEITAFTLPTAAVFCLLAGLGVADLLRRMQISNRVGRVTEAVAKGAVILLAWVPLGFHFSPCDQSRNYTGYEHAVNILRTPARGSLLLIDGDNHVFPVIYARLVEGWGEHFHIADRYNLVFRRPPVEGESGLLSGERPAPFPMEDWIGEHISQGVYLAVFDHQVFPLPEAFEPKAYGILLRLTQRGKSFSFTETKGLWDRYSTCSFYVDMERDYMNRQVCAYFHFYLARFFVQSGLLDKSLESLDLASKIGYNDEMIHSHLAVFLTDLGYFERAVRELEKALLYGEDRSAAYNNFGYYYDAMGDHERAVKSFRMAVELNPKNTVPLNNLGLALLKAGREAEAVEAWERSLRLRKNQPHIESLVKAARSSIPHEE